MMLEFDMEGLSSALENERRLRGLTWQELVKQINEPFKFAPSIPISLSTLRGMRAKRSVIKREPNEA